MGNFSQSCRVGNSGFTLTSAMVAEIFRIEMICDSSVVGKIFGNGDESHSRKGQKITLKTNTSDDLVVQGTVWKGKFPQVGQC